MLNQYHDKKRLTQQVSQAIRLSRLAIAYGLTLFPGSTVWAAINLPPIATTAMVTTKEDKSLFFTLKGKDPERKKLTYAIVNPPTQGKLTLNNTTAIYTPTPDYNNTKDTADSFSFKVNDGELDSLPATVKIIVTPSNDKPIAENIEVKAHKNINNPIILSAKDVDQDALTFKINNSKTKQAGTLTLKGNTVTYTPKYNFIGMDTFTFQAKDSKTSSSWATVNITVQDNTAPIANAGDDQSSNIGDKITLNGSGTDANGDTLTYNWQQTSGTPQVELINANSATPSFITPDLTGSATLTFTLTVNDGYGGTAQDSVDIDVQSLLSRIDAGRFLEMASFGPTPDSIIAIQSHGREAWLKQQVDLPESPITHATDIDRVLDQVFLNMANGQDQLRQRVMFALSQTLVVSTRKNSDADEILPWIRLLSRSAFGNFRTLLYDTTLNPAMGNYLDLANSRKLSSTSAPNENYPREFLQLFTIGLWQLNQDGSLKTDSNGDPIPTYNQADVAEFARALTGWTYPTAPGAMAKSRNPSYFVGIMEPRPENHDMGSKTLLNDVVLPAGQSVEKDLQMVIDNVFNHPNVPPFIATRLIRSLVTSNPSPDYIKRVADVFADNGQGIRGDLKAVVFAILTDPEATDTPTTAQGHLKDPITHILNLGHALGAQINKPSDFQYIFAKLNQKVFSPPTVFSFYSPLNLLTNNTELYGPEFQIYPPSLAIERANFIYGLLSNQYSSSFKVDLTPFTSIAGNSSYLVEKVNQVLLQGRMSSQLREIILNATNTLAPSDTKQRALGALYLTAISSEYAVQH